MRTNRYRIESDQGVVYIGLHRGHEAIIDLVELPRVEKGQWHLTRSGERLRVRGSVAGKLYQLHHYLLGVPAGTRVRYRNGNHFDNRRANLEVLPLGPQSRPRTNTTGLRNVYRVRRNGRPCYQVEIRRGDRRRFATFPDTSHGRERAARQAEAWRQDFDAPPLYPPVGSPRVRQKPGALGAPGLSIWYDRRSDVRYYLFSCQRRACRVSRYFPFTEEGLTRAQAVARAHLDEVRQTTPAASPINEVAAFMTRLPTVDELAEFHLSDAAQTRLGDLRNKDRDGALSAAERQELNELVAMGELAAAIRSRVQLSGRPEPAAHVSP